MTTEEQSIAYTIHRIAFAQRPTGDFPSSWAVFKANWQARGGSRAFDRLIKTITEEPAGRAEPKEPTPRPARKPRVPRQSLGVI
jgi:hypothetical protein